MCALIAYAGMRGAEAVDQYINDTFTQATSSGNYITGVGNTGTGNSPLVACLTAGSPTSGAIPPGCTTTLNPNNGGDPSDNGSLPDPAGLGTLRLTDDETNQSSFLIVSNPVPTSGGIQATFDIFSYGGGTGNDADGIGFLILDGTQAPPTTAGAAGGSFGYAQKNQGASTDAPGIAGGYVGIAFDEHGNFSNPTEGRVGGVGQEPESVGIRGSVATNYNFIKYATVMPNSIDSPTSKTRPQAIDVRVTFSPAGTLEVDMDFSGTSTNFQTVIAPFNVTTSIANQGALPTSLRFGFSASTGSKINFHEIRNFVAQSQTAPTLAITKVHTGTSFAANGTGTYTIQVSNGATAGPASHPIYVTDTLPIGETYVSATGTNWSCAAAIPQGQTQQTVTCTQTTALSAGANAGPITLTVNVLPNAPTPLVNSATVNTSDDSVSAGATATDTVTVVQTALLKLYKRILSITTLGPTPSPLTTPQTITYTPDPSNLTGVAGTANSETTYPGDTITYGLYYLNVGGLSALKSAAQNTLGPVLSDPLSTSLTYVAGSENSTCCTNPTSTTTATFATATTGTPMQTTLTWSLQNVLPPATNQSAIQGSITFKARVL